MKDAKIPALMEHMCISNVLFADDDGREEKCQWGSKAHMKSQNVNIVVLEPSKMRNLVS
jgi:hypothetical protein